jgi:hypothetical protein
MKVLLYERFYEPLMERCPEATSAQAAHKPRANPHAPSLRPLRPLPACAFSVVFAVDLVVVSDDLVLVFLTISLLLFPTIVSSCNDLPAARTSAGSLPRLAAPTQPHRGHALA